MSSGRATESDLLIVGGGPAGSTCAILCAAAGLRVTLLERASFPREKVCGDCLNPGCWPVFQRLGLANQVLALPHAALRYVDFIDPAGRSLTASLPAARHGEIAVKRSDLDHLLLRHAATSGAAVHENTSVTSIRRDAPGTRWQVTAGNHTYSAPVIVAADGRNSTVARLLGLLPSAVKDRVALQTHFPLPHTSHERVTMRFLPHGYCGLADVGAGQANLCLVSNPSHIEAIKSWAVAEFQLPVGQPWRSITPLERSAVPPTRSGLLLIGDAARVVEPFTGEGILYALKTGDLAADSIIRGDLTRYAAEHRALYCGRLWINILARTACKHPRFAATFLSLARRNPRVLSWLTSKVTNHSSITPPGTAPRPGEVSS